MTNCIIPYEFICTLLCPNMNKMKSQQRVKHRINKLDFDDNKPPFYWMALNLMNLYS